MYLVFFLPIIRLVNRWKSKEPIGFVLVVAILLSRHFPLPLQFLFFLSVDRDPVLNFSYFFFLFLNQKKNEFRLIFVSDAPEAIAFFFVGGGEKNEKKNLKKTGPTI